MLALLQRFIIYYDAVSLLDADRLSNNKKPKRGRTISETEEEEPIHRYIVPSKVFVYIVKVLASSCAMREAIQFSRTVGVG